MFLGFWSWVLVVLIVAAIFYANQLPQIKAQAEEKLKEGKVLLEKSKKELEAKTSVLAEKAKQKKTTVKVEKKAPEFEEEGEITAEDLEFMPKEKTKPQPKSEATEK